MTVRCGSGFITIKGGKVVATDENPIICKAKAQAGKQVKQIKQSK